MTFSFDAAERTFNLPRLVQELAAYQATARLARTRLEPGDKRGEFGPWRLEVTIPDEMDRAGLDAIVEAHDARPAPTADEKTAAVAELSNAKLTAAHNELLWARLNNQGAPQWAVDLVNSAHAKIVAARA